ncbi:hypothetical protein [Chlorobaculum tepidum]|uniref:hypothetical protein n=1 Tax=Chlorobaculum tepidum TaxID=1097 RepID=UPI001D0541DD
MDLLAILPTYFSIFVPGTQYLLVISFFRVLRIFQPLKLVKFVKEAEFNQGVAHGFGPLTLPFSPRITFPWPMM